MSWFISVGVGLAAAVVAAVAGVSVVKRTKLRARAELFGVCERCGTPCDSRQTLEYIRKHAGGNRYMQREVRVTEVYCPKCGTVKGSNRAHAIAQAEQETAW